MSTKKVLSTSGLSYLISKIKLLLNGKVDKVQGKQLSTNDYTSAEKTKLQGIQTGAEVNVNSDWNAVSGDAQILNKPTNLVQDASYVHTDNNYTTSEKTKLAGIQTGAEANVNADWNAESGDAQILNKPANLVQDANYVHTDNNFTTVEKNKLASLTPGGSGGDSSITVDTTLSSTSPNPVQNSTIYAALQGKVNTASGMGLSSNDYTTAEKTKLAGIEAGAEKNVVSGVEPQTIPDGEYLTISYSDSDDLQHSDAVPTLDMYFGAMEQLPQTFVMNVGYTNESDIFTTLTETHSESSGGETYYSKIATIPTATDSTYGLMSPTDKAKLDDIPDDVGYIYDSFLDRDLHISSKELNSYHGGVMYRLGLAYNNPGAEAINYSFPSREAVIHLIGEYAASDLYVFNIEVSNGIAMSVPDTPAGIEARTFTEVADAMNSGKLVLLNIRWITGPFSELVNKEYRSLIGNYTYDRFHNSEAIQFTGVQNGAKETIILMPYDDPAPQYLTRYNINIVEDPLYYDVNFEYNPVSDVLTATDRNGNDFDASDYIRNVIITTTPVVAKYTLSIVGDDYMYSSVGTFVGAADDHDIVSARFVINNMYYTAAIVLSEPPEYTMTITPIGSGGGGSGGVPIPVDNHGNPTYGINGQVLKTNGDGTTTWVANGMYGYGSPIPVLDISEMDDSSQIYVYIGPDVTFVNPVTHQTEILTAHGTWFYYNDNTAMFEEGGVYAAGLQGDPGVIFTPSVSSSGVLSWTNDSGLPNPQSVNIVSAVLNALPSATGVSF